MNVLALNRVKVEGMFRGGATVLTRFFRKVFACGAGRKDAFEVCERPAGFRFDETDVGFRQSVEHVRSRS